MTLFFAVIWLFFIIAITVGSARKSAAKQQAERANAERRRKAAQPGKPAARQQESILPPRPIAPSLHDHSEMFEGSLHADDGTEGSDPHDHGFDHEVDMPSMHSEEEINASLREQPGKKAPAPGKPLLDWAPNSIVRAFVMQEVLKRPGQR
ncbi:MAG: hypothetical protein IJK28_04390 [Clostridia bacterium]|nr:hypothetical protein [Clostridia bacterium]